MTRKREREDVVASQKEQSLLADTDTVDIKVPALGAGVVLCGYRLQP